MATIRPFRWGVDLAQVKNRVFLVILSDFEQFWAFWAKPLKNHGSWDHLWSAGIGRKQYTTPHRCHQRSSNGCFCVVHSKGDPNMAMVLQRFGPKCPKSIKIAQNDQKNTIFNLRQVYTPSKRPDGGQNAVFTPLGSPKGCKNRT